MGSNECLTDDFDRTSCFGFLKTFLKIYLLANQSKITHGKTLILKGRFKTWLQWLFGWHKKESITILKMHKLKRNIEFSLKNFIY
jgi:hypothetical protein